MAHQARKTFQFTGLFIVKEMGSSQMEESGVGSGGASLSSECSPSGFHYVDHYVDTVDV